MRRVPARTGAIVVVACLLVLGGCSSSPSTGAKSRGAPTPTSTTAATDRAAIAAVLAWRDGWNRSIGGKSSIAYRRTFSGKCSLCNGNAEALDRIFGDGQRITGGRYAVSGLKVQFRDGTTTVVTGRLAEGASRITAGKTVVQRLKGYSSRTSWKVVREDGRFLVANFGDAL
jgi:hypothetical protein